MFARRIAWVFVTIALVSAPVSAQTTLAWKFAKGDGYEVERLASQKQTVALKGTTLKQDSTSIWLVRLEVKEKKENAFALQATLVTVEHNLVLHPKSDNVQPKYSQALEGSSFLLLVTPDGRIQEMQGYEELLNRLVAALGNTTVGEKMRREGVRAAFPEASLKENFADLFGPLPDKAVAKGDVWQRETVEPIPHFGALHASARYVYAGKTEAHERIAYSLQTKYEAPKADAMVLFRVVKGKIDSEKAKGSIAFDAVTGHLVEHERSMQVRGTLTIDSMGREQAIEFSSVSELRIRVKKK